MQYSETLQQKDEESIRESIHVDESKSESYAKEEEYIKQAIVDDKFKLYKVETKRQLGNKNCVYKFELANKNKKLLPDKYLSVHYDDLGQLEKIEIPDGKEIQFRKDVPYIEVEGEKYFIPIKKENFTQLQAELKKNDNFSDMNLSVSFAEEVKNLTKAIQILEPSNNSSSVRSQSSGRSMKSRSMKF